MKDRAPRAGLLAGWGGSSTEGGSEGHRFHSVGNEGSRFEHNMIFSVFRTCRMQFCLNVRRVWLCTK